jgi:hypothetical protein
VNLRQLGFYFYDRNVYLEDLKSKDVQHTNEVGGRGGGHKRLIDTLYQPIENSVNEIKRAKGTSTTVTQTNLSNLATNRVKLLTLRRLALTVHPYWQLPADKVSSTYNMLNNVTDHLLQLKGNCVDALSSS